MLCMPAVLEAVSLLRSMVAIQSGRAAMTDAPCQAKLQRHIQPRAWLQVKVVCTLKMLHHQSLPCGGM